MEAKVALWREVEAGTLYTAKTAMERYPQLHLSSFKGLPSEIAKKPKGDAFGDRARDVKTYLAADLDALAALLAAPDPVDPRWREVEAGTRFTRATAMERYPQLNTKSFNDLPCEVARQPKSGPGRGGSARDVKTYLAADVDALAARLAAPDQVDPRWREVEAGTRFTAKTAMERYPHLNWHSFDGLPSKIARQPKQSDHENSRACDVKTYAAADVDALAANHAPQPVDPRWLEVESGARYDARTATKRYPQLRWQLLADFPFEIARRPKSGKARSACDVKTYAAADVEKLAAARAKKRARVQEPEPPQEEPEPEEEPEECPVCLDPMTGATATLVCGHPFCKDCITDWARSQTTCPTCRATLQVA
ncbi:hypothetical protein JL720_9081 [Aureococcus anophagefferens]|nr:hypothetical protein JL720_9081 [Aureococcus anophagefferens]